VTTVENATRSEIVLQIKFRPAVGGSGWSALVESPEPGSQIRFQDLQTFVRYLQALSDSRPIRGLR
jgi:hypothetical protein